MDKYSNIDNSNYYIYNDRNERIHIQHFIQNNAKAVIFFLHGYSAHGNRATHKYIANTLNKNNYSYVTFDFHSHGYSDGDDKGLIENYGNLVNDALLVIKNFFDLHSNIPFFIMGHSCGGGVGILLSHMFSSSTPLYTTNIFCNHDIFKKLQFKGLLMFSPVIQLTSLSDCFQDLLVGTVSYFMPNYCLPRILYDETYLHTKNWKDPNYANYVFKDCILTYGGNIKFVTLYSILKMARTIQSILHETSFPWIIFHDPHDVIVPFSGSLLMFQKSSSNDKKIVEMYDDLHDLLANNIEKITFESIIWFDHQIALPMSSI